MDPGQQFCLRWNNYQSTLQHVFHKLWVAGTFVDVSLVVEGRRLDCHKVVLSACSSYFEHILRDHSSHPHPLILLHDLPYSAVEALVTFMYRGEVNVSQEQLAALLKVAETLRVKGLADSGAISSFTKRQLLERCIPLLEHAPCNPPPPNPSVNNLGAVTVPTTSIVQPRMTPTRVSLGKTGSGVLKNLCSGGIKRVEPYCSSTSPGPKKKRPRSEEMIPSAPPTNSLSSNELPPSEAAQPSPSPSAVPAEIFKQEAADETDGELQIDESAGQSPVEPPECDGNSIDPEVETEAEDEDSHQNLSQEVKSVVKQDVPPLHQSEGAVTIPKDNLEPSQQFSHLHQGPLDSLQGKERSSNIGGKSCERTYTHLDLEEGIEAVLLGHLTPAKAIAQYRIPRRTFFRRLSAVRKSRGIPSAKENAADHFLTASAPVGGDTSSQLMLPVSDSESYAASFKVKSDRPVLIAPKEAKNKGKKGDGVMAPNNSYFSLLNLAATNNYDAYLNYLKLVAQQGDNANPEEIIEALRKGQVKEGKPAVDDNRNVSEAALALVAHNVSSE